MNLVTQDSTNFEMYMDQHMRFQYLSNFQAMKAYLNHGKYADSPEPLLQAYTRGIGVDEVSD